MFTVYAGNICIYNDILQTDETMLMNPKFEMEDNVSGSFNFTIPPSNAGYNHINRLTTIISIDKDGKLIWEGRVLTDTTDFYGNRSLYCEGSLAFLNDTVQPQREYYNLSPRSYLSTLLNIHNQNVGDEKKFSVGYVTVSDPDQAVYRYTNFENTMTLINDEMIKPLGGHLTVRYEDGTRYLDYFKDYPRTSSQIVRFGENLIDYTRSWDSTDFFTVLYPLGARVERSKDELDSKPALYEVLEEYTTIDSVNGGKQYVYNSAAVSKYGWIEKIMHFDDITSPSELLTAARKEIQDLQFDLMEIELSAVDLHYLNVDVSDIRLLDQVRVISEPHGLDRYFPVKKISIPLDRPENATFTLGDTVVTGNSIATSTSDASRRILNALRKITPKNELLTLAIADATKLITATGKGGHVVFSPNANSPEEIFIMDTTDPETAKRVWRWNINGLGYSNKGINGPFETAMTMDGTIVGKFIAANSISTEQITATFKTKVDSIDGKVSYTNVIQSINMSSEGIKIDASKFNVNAEAIRLQTSALSWSADYSKMEANGTLTVQQMKAKYGVEIYSENSNWQNGEAYIDFHMAKSTSSGDYDGRFCYEQGSHDFDGAFKFKSSSQQPDATVELGAVAIRNNFNAVLVRDGSSWEAGYTGNIATGNGYLRFINGICIGPS